MILLTPRCLDEARCPFQAGLFCTRTDCATEDDQVKFPCSVTAHEKRLRQLACSVTGRTPVTLHHTRGASMKTNPFGGPGAGQKQNPALQIPLVAELHFGRFGIDARIGSSAQSWERKWGLQTKHLDLTSHHLRYSPWTLAYLWASPLVQERVGRFLRDSLSRCLRP